MTMQLAQLTGSPKQTAWAHSIRPKVLAEISEWSDQDLAEQMTFHISTISESGFWISLVKKRRPGEDLMARLFRNSDIRDHVQMPLPYRNYISRSSSAHAE
jgi:hypothetical protein